MFVENLKQEVYDVISTERVLVLVALDVDAVCACKIIKWLFQQDHVRYTVVPVLGQEDLVNAYAEHKDQIQHFFLVNCGGNINLLNALDANEESTFYIADSHRPLDLDNVYNQDQIKILIKEGDTFDEIPEFEKIFEDGDDDSSGQEDEDDDEGSEPSAKRQKTDISALEKRVKKKRWAGERDKILFDYYEYAYYGSAAAVILYELAWKLSKDNNDLLWWSIVGLTEQYMFSKIDREKYFEDAENLREHVLRHNMSDEKSSVSCMSISYEEELHLSLYRHWTIFDSFCNSQYTTCGLRLFTMKGKKKLHEMFADMGLPIVQCQQKFSSMDVELRNNVKEWIQNLSEKYGLEDLSYGSFVAQYGYKTKVCASDIVYSTTALLEYAKEGQSDSDHFLDAVDALSRANSEKQEEGITLAKSQIVSLVGQVRSFIDTHQIVCGGPFLYAYAQEGTPNSHLFSKPAALCRLARFTLAAYGVMTKNKKAKNLPFVLAVPYDIEKGTCLLVGVPPINEESPKNFFGAAFHKAAESSKSRTHHDAFDPTVVEIKTEDRTKFFDALSALMV